MSALSRDWPVLKPWVWLAVAVTLPFLIGSFVLDALFPTGLRDAFLLTLPTSTGDVVADYAITVWQVAVLAVGVLAGIRLARREA